MLTRTEYNTVRAAAADIFDKAHIVLTGSERDNIEVADFGLGDIYNTGLELVTYVNTTRCCAKELVMLPYQTCPEHTHAPIPEKNYPGKEETFRCKYGTVYLFVEGEGERASASVAPPAGVYTVFHEIKLTPGQQYTLAPNTKHWFKGGPEGAVVSEFSTPSFDECDIFTDPAIKRIPEIEG